MSLQPGARLGHYDVVAPLGAGGMGEVYRATDTKLGREVALKVLPDEVARDPDRLARFQREAKALAALDHPNIVTVFSVEEADGVHFLTMQLVDGQPLDRLIPERGLSIERIVGLATALADALATAHEKGIVHRDLKPPNVMVTDDGRVKVLDFGLAKVPSVAQGPGPASDATFTSAGRTAVGVVMARLHVARAGRRACGRPSNRSRTCVRRSARWRPRWTGASATRFERPAWSSGVFVSQHVPTVNPASPASRSGAAPVRRSAPASGDATAQ